MRPPSILTDEGREGRKAPARIHIESREGELSAVIPGDGGLARGSSRQGQGRGGPSTISSFEGGSGPSQEAATSGFEGRTWGRFLRHPTRYSPKDSLEIRRFADRCPAVAPLRLTLRSPPQGRSGCALSPCTRIRRSATAPFLSRSPSTRRRGPQRRWGSSY